MKILIFISIFLLTTGQLEALEPYQATYRVEIKAGVKAKATAEIKLDYSDPDSAYQYRSVTRAKGFAKMLRSKPVVESSTFRLSQGELTPVRYEFQDGSKKNKRGDRADFDWRQGTVATRYKGEDKSLSLSAGVVDRNLLPIDMMLRCPAIQGTSKKKVVSRGQIRDYELSVLGKETLKTKIGTLQTIKIKQQRVGSSRSTISWLSPEHNCIVVQVHQFKEDKKIGSLEIESLNRS